MADQKMIRLSQAARKLNVGITTLAEELAKKGFKVEAKPNAKITLDQYAMLESEFQDSVEAKEKASSLSIGASLPNAPGGADQTKKEEAADSESNFNKKTEPQAPAQPVKETVAEKPKAEKQKPKKVEEPETISAKLPGLKVIDKIDLGTTKKKSPPPTKKVVPKEELAQEEKPIEKVAPEEPVVAKTAKEPVHEPPVKEVEAVTEIEVPQIKAEQEAPKMTSLTEEPSEPEKPVTETKEIEATLPKEEKVEPVKEEKPIEVESSTKPPVVEQKSETLGTSEAESEEAVQEGDATIKAKADSLQGLKVLGKIELPSNKPKKKVKKEGSPMTPKDRQNAARIEAENRNKKRKRVKVSKGSKIDPAAIGNKSEPSKADGSGTSTSARRKDTSGTASGKRKKKEEISAKEVKKGYQQTLSKLGGKTNKSNRSKYKREKRSNIAAQEEVRLQRELDEANVLKVAEFISTNELASMMDVGVNEIIGKCMSLGMFISINQRLDAETIEMITEDFGFEVEFASAEEEIEVAPVEQEDKPEDLKERAPIVTIMGHVDHGKTSLLDYIRDAKVAQGEAGGITQHIGAYDVTTRSGKRIAFLDTPGHEAFTAMRARGAKLTDVAIIVVAADDSVMPQTVEAINHAQVAGVPIVIAINKIDKPAADPNKIKEALANINILVEDWGGKYQSYNISAKTGEGIDDMLEGVVLESDVLELKANPDKNANGTVVEASLDKGRGYVATILVQEGTMKVGDVILAGHNYGKVKAMTDHRGKKVKSAGPATPVQVLGLNGAPQAGDKVNVLDSEREAREIATKREQIVREQSIRATRRTTLSDLGKRIAIGNFQQLNVIIRGDVDGSIEALSDSLLKLSTEEVEVNIIQKAVGPISESDILLASASDAVVIGFQVRPTASAKKIAEKEEIEIRLYSVIYDAINDVKQAMEGMLAPDIEEIIVGNAEVRDVFKISKVGTVAGCYVTEGYIKRNAKIRIIRDSIVLYGGEKGGDIGALKRFKDDVSEVKQGFECGLSIKDYNDLKVGDVIEAFEQKEVKRKLSSTTVKA